jgi:hypothetical protein
LDQCSTRQSRLALPEKFGVTVSAFGAAALQCRSQQDARRDEDDCLSIAALRAVNNLPASYRGLLGIESNNQAGLPTSSLIQTQGETMKRTTIALALAFTLPATFALAQAPMNLPGTEYRTTGVTVALPGTELPTTGVAVGQTGLIATRPMNISGNTLGPIAVSVDPSGSTLTPAALVRGR